MAKRPYDPNQLVFDSGQTADTRRLKGAGLAVAGRAQARQRDPFARSMGPGWDSYFGLMQAKENAANVAGKNFEVDPYSWGNDAVKPTTVFDGAQTPSSLGGIYNTSGATVDELTETPVRKPVRSGRKR
jgi:hypothetical protein